VIRSTHVYDALLGVLKRKRSWWHPADIEDDKALRRILNDPRLVEQLTEELNK
jgi:hypothetical protein